MKKTFILLVIACFILVCANAHCELYPRLFVVTEIDQLNDFITLQDFNGFMFLYEGCEDWVIGDLVAAIMWDNDTFRTITDDIIISIRYEGYLEGWMEILQGINIETHEQLPY